MKYGVLLVLGFTASFLAWTGGIVPGVLVTAGMIYLAWRALTR
jgi:hypothetical protein